MPSFEIINYSLRPSKAIQRQLIFEGIRLLHLRLRLKRSVYIGLGSVWFTDFILAHQMLDVRDMVSMEDDEIGFRRAQFNSPYATVRVRRGSSSTILPQLLGDQELNDRPWIVWLDYDGEFDEVLRDDVRLVVGNSPFNTIVLVTFNAHENNYGHANERPERLKQLFGDVVPDNLSKRSCKSPVVQQTLADFAIKFMRSAAADAVRPGGFLPTVRMLYQDGAPMVTVGGIVPATKSVTTVRRILGGTKWRCWPAEIVRAPHLTIREALALQSRLPSAASLTRGDVRSLGFDLKDEQIEVYEKYYREYPNYAQIRT